MDRFTRMTTPSRRAEVSRIVRSVARAAGLVTSTRTSCGTPLTTQAINRGMQLKAITAMSATAGLHMTMV